MCRNASVSPRRFTAQRNAPHRDGRDVVYDYADLNEITLAGATSIYKSQGSEYPVVILPLYTQHYVMLSRNLFYTGLTRAKKLALIVGSQKAIAIAVKQVKQQQRYTRLKERLESKFLQSRLPYN
nr:ATP-dependent RecD-like DNA helicase [Pleurocapsa sp. FMAR1]